MPICRARFKDRFPQYRLPAPYLLYCAESMLQRGCTPLQAFQRLDSYQVRVNANGMTESAIAHEPPSSEWIPACAGMTCMGWHPGCARPQPECAPVQADSVSLNTNARSL